MLNVSFDFAEKLKISTINLYDERNPSIEIPVWEEFENNIKNKIEHDYIKKIVISRLDEIFNMIFRLLPDDKNFYSYLFTGGGSKIKNFNYTSGLNLAMRYNFLFPQVHQVFQKYSTTQASCLYIVLIGFKYLKLMKKRTFEKIDSFF